jgi:hypothetical protein
LRALREQAVEFEAAHAAECEALHPNYRNSARNDESVRSRRRSVPM